ncbi:MAG TPA: sugar transferase, partial [Candidatus Limnocylindria bacterium]|nr:sugar transferase [Candidatus Limnocylindria bacterium]
MPRADQMRQPTGELLVPAAPTATGYRLAKRSLDIVGALVGLLITSPVLGLVAVAVKLDSPGPVLFSQIRLGCGGQPFTVLKFRTMHLSA